MRIARTSVTLAVLALVLCAPTACSLGPQTVSPAPQTSESSPSIPREVSDFPLRADENPGKCGRHNDTVHFSEDAPTGTISGYADCLTEGTKLISVLYVNGTYYKLDKGPIDLDHQGRFSHNYKLPDTGAAPGTVASLQVVAASGPDLDQLLTAEATFGELPAGSVVAGQVVLPL